MANYGEDLVYWYLRLNGFFPLTNFVMHARGLGRTQSAERDVLAIRFPYVFEEVGGRENDWDALLCKALDMSCPIGLICEVKAGKDATHTQLNDPKALLYSLHRLGFFPGDLATEARDLLLERSVVEHEGFGLAKLFFAKEANPNIKSPTAIGISFEHIIDFIQQRIGNYPAEKYEAWVHFDSNLLQFLIHQ